MHEEELEDDYEYDENGEIVYYALRPNKTAIKREIAACAVLGEELSALQLTQLQAFNLPDNIEKAIIELAKMPHKGARKRQLKYIAGQLHKLDVAPIKERLDKLKNKSAHAVREHHQAEKWRDSLIHGGNDALTDLLDDYPDADRQHIRQLVRNAQKEAKENKPPKSARLLYRYLKDLIQNDYEEELIEQDYLEAEDNETEDDWFDDEDDDEDDFDDEDE